MRRLLDKMEHLSQEGHHQMWLTSKELQKQIRPSSN